MSVAYDPSSRFEIKTWDTEFRRIPTRTLMARVYQPQGAGPFPVLLDLHGGAWNNQDRTANAMMDEALAKSGILVVAIDLTRAPEAPYPACVQDASYALRATGTAMPQRSVHWAVPAAGTRSSYAPCGRTIRTIACTSWPKHPILMRL